MNSTSSGNSISNYFLAKPAHINYMINWSVQHKLIYVETPKVGCTTIKQILQHAEYDYDTSKVSMKDHDLLHDRSCSPLKSPEYNEALFLNCINSEDYFTFSFVRNPFTRVLSAYLDKIVGKPGVFNQFQKRIGIDSSSNIPSFNEFLEIIYTQPEVEMDPHWAPQSFLLGCDKVHYDFLGRFENFDDSINELISRTKLRLLPEANSLGRAHATSASDQLKEYYTKRAIHRVREIYSEDFRRLGYGWSP